MPEAILIAPGLTIGRDEVSETFVRAAGPGGQNVNKVASAVQVRFDLVGSPSLPGPVKVRAAALAGGRLGKDGVITIAAQRFRTQKLNRQDGLNRLLALLREAASPPPAVRRATRPTKASRERRLERKARRAGVKLMRGPVGDD